MESHIQIKKGEIISRASVGELLATMFLECLSRGMTLPFTVCHMGANGGVCVTRLSNLDSPMNEVFKTSERIEPPINVMIVDQLGQSFKVSATQQDEALHVSAPDPDHLH